MMYCYKKYHSEFRILEITTHTQLTDKMSMIFYEKVRHYFDSIGLGNRVIVREHIGDTVENAAEAVGCDPAQIGKTMSFIQN